MRLKTKIKLSFMSRVSMDKILIYYKTQGSLFIITIDVYSIGSVNTGYRRICGCLLLYASRNTSAIYNNEFSIYRHNRNTILDSRENQHWGGT